MIVPKVDIISSISIQLEKLMEQLKLDIINLNQAEGYNEKTKIQKIITENLQKILNIIEKIKKLEKLFLYDRQKQEVSDQKILEEFVNKIRKEKR